MHKFKQQVPYIIEQNLAKLLYSQVQIDTTRNIRFWQ